MIATAEVTDPPHEHEKPLRLETAEPEPEPEPAADFLVVGPHEHHGIQTFRYTRQPDGGWTVSGYYWRGWIAHPVRVSTDTVRAVLTNGRNVVLPFVPLSMPQRDHVAAYLR